ncbi:MAG: trimeric intracellular cation channel family protein [Velocimicrobium sp.]
MQFVEKIVSIIELVGIAAFAISGAMVAIQKKLDLFGVIVLGITTSLGGGVIRDLLLGRVPPMMFQKPIYAILATMCSAMTFVFVYRVGRLEESQKMLYENVINFLDAIGLGVFAATSVNMVLTNYVKPGIFLSVFMGTITAVGGSILRDMMSNEIPLILKKRIYAIAAIMGSVIYYILWNLKVPFSVTMFMSIFITVIIRLLAKRYRWNLPTVCK